MTIIQKISGISLIEVLVTLVVVAIGLLGFTKLQLGSIDLSVYAHQRSMATAIAHDYIERIRANPDELAFYQHTINAEIQAGDAIQPEKFCIKNACNTEDLALNDKFIWQDHIKSQQYSTLVQPKSSLLCDGEGREAVCALSIFWQKKSSMFNSTGGFSQKQCNPAGGESDESVEYHCVTIHFKPEQRHYVPAV